MKHNPKSKCSICDRELGDIKIEWHHLMPKSLGGKETFPIHGICHRKIHSTFTERELKNFYNTFERLRENENIKKFVSWVAKKDPSYYDSSNFSNNRRKKR